MADVTEVIHKISYEVNDDALQNATKAIETQLKELLKLNEALENHSKQLIRLTDTESKRQDELLRKILQVNQQILSSASSTQASIAEVFKAVIMGSRPAETSVKAYVKNVRSSFKELVSSSKKTKVGFAAHLMSASKIGTRSIKSLLLNVGKLGRSLLSFTGFASIAANVLVTFGMEMFNSSKRTKVFTQEMKDAADFAQKLGIEAGNELSTLVQLRSKIEDLSLSYSDRNDAIAELRKLYPDYFSDLTDEEIKAGRVAEAYNKITKGIIASAKARVYDKQLDEAIEKVIAAEQKIADDEKEKGGKLDRSEDAISGLTKYNVPTRTDLENVADLTKISLGTSSAAINNKNEDQYAYAKVLIKEYNSHLFEVNRLLALMGENNKLIASLRPPKKTPKVDKPFKKVIKEKKKEQIERIAPRETELLPVDFQEDRQLEQVETPELQTNDEKSKKSIKELLDPFRNLSQEQKDEIKEKIEGYRQLAQAAGDAYNSILQVQIDALDKEIAIREKRVDAARKIAERGNVEVLKLEEERLRKAQQKRERFARRQQAVNAAITVSNAIAAVARAALEGGGFGSAATIAALIAAMAAGYAAVTSLSSDGGAFADGVVDYKGKGGPKDDKNWVRISSGESVITAEGTQKNRKLLEAINNGATLQMIDPSLPFMMPSFKQPSVIGQNNYAKATDLKSLEYKMDEVVVAIENNKFKQNVFFNEHGVGLMTEKAIRKEQKRWK